MTVGLRDLSVRWRIVGICLIINALSWRMVGRKDRLSFGCGIGMRLERNGLRRGR